MTPPAHLDGLPRRRFMQLAAAGLAVAAIDPLRLAGLRRDAHGAESDRASGPGLITRVARPYDAETEVSVFEQWITPVDRFFVRSHFGPPDPATADPASWRLRVSGLVDRPLELRLPDLWNLPEVTLAAVLQCSGNGRAFHRPRTGGVQWERGAVGNARWTGVRLRDVLGLAGLKPEGKHLHLLGADRPVSDKTPLFHRSIPLEKALHPDTLLVYRMNGAPLPLLHGAPLRLVTPGWMADACVKWLTDLTASETEPQGYFMQTAYRRPSRPIRPGEMPPPDQMEPVTEMVVKSLITSPTEGQRLSAGSVKVAGVAWTGEGRISAVQVSTDDGRIWMPARLLGDDLPYAWRRWECLMPKVAAGAVTFLSRAQDDRGRLQPQRSPWNPGGFLWNGWDRVQARAEA